MSHRALRADTEPRRIGRNWKMDKASFGDILPNGARLVDKKHMGRSDWLIIATWFNGRHEWITWRTDSNGNCAWGNYQLTLTEAVSVFELRQENGALNNG